MSQPPDPIPRSLREWLAAHDRADVVDSRLPPLSIYAAAAIRLNIGPPPFAVLENWSSQIRITRSILIESTIVFIQRARSMGISTDLIKRSIAIDDDVSLGTHEEDLLRELRHISQLAGRPRRPGSPTPRSPSTRQRPGRVLAAEHYGEPLARRPWCP